LNNIANTFIKTISSILVIGIYTLPASAETWNLKNISIGVMLGDEERTKNKSLEGRKIVLDGRYVIHSEEHKNSDRPLCCSRQSKRDIFIGLIDTQMRISADGDNLQYLRLGFTPWATQIKPLYEDSENLRTERDMLELFAIRYITDDLLEVDYYTELAVLRAARLGTYNWSDSAFTAIFGMQVSTGWAWAESKDKTYGNVSNPFAGIYYNVALEHETWGKIYTTQRFVNGFSFSSPARGHPTAREAQVRAGYLKKLGDHSSIDIFIEKRSFNFIDGGLPALYTKSGSAGVELFYQWF